MNRGTRLRAAAVATLAATLAWAAGARAAGGIVPLLQPGNRDAPGLGGDPFRSPLRDECGWWSEPGFSPAPIVRLQSVAGDPLTRRATGGNGSLSYGETSLDLAGATRRAGRMLLLAGRFTSPHWSGAIAAAGGELEIGGKGGRADAGVRLEGAIPGLTLQAAGPLWAEGGRSQTTNFGAGLRYRPRAWLATQASWRAVRTPEALTSDLGGQAIETSLNLKSEQRRLDARFALGARVALEGSVARTRYAPIAPRTPAFRYELMPAGAARLDQASAHVDVARGLGVLARWTRAGVDAEGDATWGGERFGRLNYARATLESQLLAIETRGGGGARWILDAERVRGQATARGVLETWPFTSTLVDLLGLRRIGRLNAEARWHRLHAGHERGLGAECRAQFGVAWYDLAPLATIESWRPAFLVFGRADERVDRLDVRRAQLASVSLGGTWRMGRIEGALAIEQFVFAKAFRAPRDAAAPPSVGTAEPVGAATGGPRAGGWPGGTRLDFSLGRRF